jgi:ABC-type lipoprotein export system ATPase subunit
VVRHSQLLHSQRREDCEYLMIKRLELRNFRCYRHLDLSLKQFNIVVGESGSGKTTLLESLFLIAGSNPEIYLRLRNWRGFSRALNLTGSREQFKSIFSDLFYDFDDSNGAVLSFEDSTFGSRKLEVGYSDSVKFGLDLNDPEPHAFTILPVEFKYVVDGRVHTTSLSIAGGKFSIEGAAPVAPLAYYNAINTTSFETTSAFSILSRKFRVTHLIESIGAIYPQVKDISLELIAGDPTLCATTYGLSQRIPLGDLSGGVAKFVTIALAILMNPRGTVIVDEFESGLYYRNIGTVWKALVQLAIQEKVQLVVTTHSYEFLQAAAPVLAADGNAKNSQLLRAELGADGAHTIRQIPATALNAATSQDFEVR